MTEAVDGFAREVDPVRITGVDLFPIEIPTPAEELERGVVNTYPVVRIDTDAGVRGWSFAGPPADLLESRIRPALVGRSLFAVEDHLRAGVVDWLGLEHAIWDAIGKVAGQPVYRLLGGSKTAIDAYLTSVWIGNPDQSHVAFDDQAAWAVQVKEAGYRGIKIRAWRPDPIDDVRACGVIREAVGDDFEIMVDRTADYVGHVWDYDTALAVARGLEKHRVGWLEEPLARDDYEGTARLTRETDITISGGEGYTGLAAWAACVRHGAYDLWQPDAQFAGGILMVQKVASIAQAFGKRCFLHGNLGLKQAAWLQCSAILGAEWHELVYVNPPLWPQEHWAPGLKVLNQDEIFVIRDGRIHVPQRPGLGLDVNEDAIEEFRVR